MLVPSAPEKERLEGSSSRKSFCYHRNKVPRSVLFTKTTSSNEFFGEAGNGSHPIEKQTQRACVLSPILLTLDSGLPLLELEAHDVPLVACYSLVFTARLGFFTLSRGCKTPSPNTHGVLNYLIANRFQHLFTPTCHSEPYSPSFGVNTIATSAASECVNKPSGETITLLAFRNKPWSLH